MKTNADLFAEAALETARRGKRGSATNVLRQNVETPTLELAHAPLTGGDAVDVDTPRWCRRGNSGVAPRSGHATPFPLVGIEIRGMVDALVGL